MDTYDVPGVTIALVEDGAVVWNSGFGVADTSTGEPVTSETVFRVASISKPVAAWAVLSLVDGGAIGLDSPVHTHLSRWQLPGSVFDEDGVTVRRLLSHSAGTSVDYINFIPGTEPMPTLQEQLAGAWSDGGPVELIAEPGTQYSYSGAGYSILQLLVEEVTGDEFGTWAKREVLDPLGMSHSTFDQATAIPGLATGHDSAAEPIQPYRYAGLAGAGLFSTAADLGRFVAAAMPGRDGEAPGRGVLEPETVDAMLSAEIDTEVPGIGSGLGYLLDHRSGTLVAAHSGSDVGWNAKVLFVPSAERGIVILTNSDNGGNLHVQLGCAWSAWATDQAITDVCP
jgi:CubicO group peptidase (beta-lactamase class C family)